MNFKCKMDVCKKLYSIIQEGSKFSHNDVKLCSYTCEYYDPVYNYCHIFGDLAYMPLNKTSLPVRHEKCMELLGE